MTGAGRAGSVKGSGMSDSSELERAEVRLRAALDALETAVNRRLAEIAAITSMKAEVHALAEDRAYMAADLDRSMARASVLEEANRQAIGRIDGAMDTVRAVLTRKAG